ncbi:MAG: response regulator [bacterium]|nr:response regulator [bacterium]
MKALIVDDEEEIRDALAAGLQYAQCKWVNMAANGEEALRMGLQTEYDLITLDIRMPSLTGIDILPTLRTMLPHAVIAIVSAFVSESVTDVHREHADLVLQKPFEMERILKLYRLSEEMLERRSKIRALSEWNATERKPGKVGDLTGVRLARATDQMEEVIRFYRDGVGLVEPKGENGRTVMDLPGIGCQLVFTRPSGTSRQGEEEALVLELCETEAFSSIVSRLRSMGYDPLTSGPLLQDEAIFQDPDGRRLVLQCVTDSSKV